MDEREEKDKNYFTLLGKRTQLAKKYFDLSEEMKLPPIPKRRSCTELNLD